MTPNATRIRRLSLTNFRSYRAASLRVETSAVVLVGPNGAGKTNLIEAISFLAPGRGLRRATLDEVARDEGDGSWAVSVEVEGALGLVQLGTGIDAAGAEGAEGAATTARRCRIDREPVSSAAAFADHLRVIWMVPAMDGLFAGPASERRRFLDRLVLAVDSAHGARVNALERALRSRNRLLEDTAPDPHWLDAIERETAELAVAVAAARVEATRRLASVIEAQRADGTAFPWAGLGLDGSIEKGLGSHPASDIEDRYRVRLRENRARDAAAGRTLEGPHVTDLGVVYGPKGVPAVQASTGEQKALLIGLVLAHARMIAQMTGFAPVVLLDEVVAHLDPQRRAALFAALGALGAQVWMTGADPQSFAELEGRAEVFDVTPGTIMRRGG